MANLLGQATATKNQQQAQGAVNQYLNPAYQSLIQPQLNAYNSNQNAQIQSLNQQLGMANTQYGVDTAYQNTQTGFGRERLGLQGEQLGINQGALNRQMNQYLPAQESLANSGFNLQGRQMDFGADQQRRGLTSDATARGAMVTEGTRQGFSDIETQLGFGKEGLYYNKLGSDLSFRQQRDQLKDEQKNLDIASKSLGIDKRELESQATRALQQLGLSAMLSSGDIIKAINDVSAGLDNPLYSLLPQIYQLTGLRPTAPATGQKAGSSASISRQNTGPAPVNKGGVQASGAAGRRF